MTKLVRYDFDFLSNLDDYSKESISLGKWSLYKMHTGEFLMVIPGGCPCCHANKTNQYFILNDQGSFLKTATESWYQDLIKDHNNTLLEIIKFDLPERITKNYYKIKF